MLILAGCNTATTDDVDPGPLVRNVDITLRSPATTSWGAAARLPGGTAVVLARGSRPVRAVGVGDGATLWTGPAGAVGDTVAVGGNPARVAVGGRGRRQVVILDAVSGERVGAVRLDDAESAGALAWTGAGALLVSTGERVVVADRDGRINASIEQKGGAALAADTSRGTVWATVGAGLAELDPIDPGVVSRIDLDVCGGPDGLAIDAASDTAVVACGRSGTLTRVSLQSGYAQRPVDAPPDVRQVVLGRGPAQDGSVVTGAVAWNADGDAATYVFTERSLHLRGTQHLGVGAGGLVALGRRFLVAVGEPPRLRSLVTIWPNR